MLPVAEVDDITKRIREHFPETRIEGCQPNRINLVAPLPCLLSLASYLKESEGFDHVTSVTGIDYPDKNLVTVTYHLGAYVKLTLRRLVLSITVNLPRQEAKIPTLIPVWPSAEYHERETHEMVGVVFQDHPNMKLLLLPEDWIDGPPLRKEFKLRGR